MGKPVELRLESFEPENRYEGIEEYLECLTAPLVGVVSYQERSRFKEETRFHLESLMEQERQAGTSIEEAQSRAIFKYGPSHEISLAYLNSWNEAQDSGFLKGLGRSNGISLAIFGLSQLAISGLVLSRIFSPNMQSQTLVVDLVQFYTIFPAGSPLPELTFSFVALCVFAVLTPWIAGYLIGKNVSFRPIRAVYLGLLPCTLYAFVNGVAFLPNREMLTIAILQLAYWLPVAIVVAHFVSFKTRLSNANFRDSRIRSLR